MASNMQHSTKELSYKQTRSKLFWLRLSKETCFDRFILTQSEQLSKLRIYRYDQNIHVTLRFNLDLS